MCYLITYDMMISIFSFSRWNAILVNIIYMIKPGKTLCVFKQYSRGTVVTKVSSIDQTSRANFGVSVVNMPRYFPCYNGTVLHLPRLQILLTKLILVTKAVSVIVSLFDMRTALRMTVRQDNTNGAFRVWQVGSDLTFVGSTSTVSRCFVVILNDG